MKTNSEETAEQIRKHSNSIGQGVSTTYLAQIIEFSTDVSRRDWYAKREIVPFWYERYDKAGLTEKLSVLADAWAQVSKPNTNHVLIEADRRIKDTENIKRAAAQVARPQKPAGKELVSAFGIYKFKKYMKEEWELVQHPARGFGGEKEFQTMVCIALEDLGPANGFPFELGCGQDVCIDSEEPLWLPPTGGGMAILIWLRL